MEAGLRVFRDAVAIVTGGASGIGRALAEELVAQGAQVVLVDLQGSLAEEVAGSLRRSGGVATAVELDASDFEALSALVAETVRANGRLDFLFNNAGVGIGGEIQLFEDEDWERSFEYNVRSVANGIRSAYPIMLEQGFGHIVNTSSMAALFPSPLSAVYAATKGAVLSLSLALRAESSDLGVRVSALCPGVVDTPILESGGVYGRMVQNIPPERLREHWEQFSPMDPKRFAHKALRAVGKNKAIFIAPFRWKIVWWLNRLSPALGLWLVRGPCRQGRRLLRTGEW